MFLSLLLFLIPFASALVAWNFPNKRLAFVLSLLPLALLAWGHSQWLGTELKLPWFPALSIDFHLKIDPLSLVFISLTALIVPIAIASTRSSDVALPGLFYALILIVQGFLLGFFMARDLVLFTLLYEAMLIPLYFIIAQGGKSEQRAAFQFILYMIAGSALLVAAVLALFAVKGTFNLDLLAQGKGYAAWIAAIFFLAFAVKTPLFPLHGWLPEAYTRAPTAGSILLSALLSKAGVYGFMRIGTELFPEHLQTWGPLLLALAITGVLYAGFAAWMQNDYKRLIAYSSFAHVNFILAGLFVWGSEVGFTGAVLQSFNHGITIAALFLVAGWLEERIGTTQFAQFSGLAKFLPTLAWLTLFFVLSSVALPGTNNFIGEVLILFALFLKNPWAAAILGTTVILSVIYMLRWMQKLYFGAPNPLNKTYVDIHGKELLIALPLIVLTLWVGLYPKPFLTVLQPILAQLEKSP